ncbi:Crp/Fnr family transcriptional regulator [Ketobacter sp. MCCC 1A13808]|uniref:Crp/Fnr family transcriptional regulator n=1 Tax=Ketobacter sp. MCCC 1A13808 TaxID=2602738 RepID=UPI000F12C19C|nr:Crp/Fnr family transcriptional regulator [Ketobacter sp. MCCC 1A13808]MVF10569.1 Crp/Fnr family transcriptional regulator [Ketobacter sp. MCCC 1A13808]RLP55996.1 MAG: Crp/Fnr family transcriptional regulator [Ketobacter sp.]|tara:strand:- start:152 stop:670 length:519 start_codon:yes stop_codon:yes gene_type:complete
MTALDLDRVHMLQNVPTFGGINDEVLSFLLDHSKTVNRAAGQEVFHEGDYTASMFIIEEGEVAIFKQKAGQNCLMVTLGEGECLGEMALFDYMPRSASAVAHTKCSLIEITSQNLYEVYKKDLEQFALLQMNLGREIARRLRRADELCVKCPLRPGNESDSGVGVKPFRQYQ